MLSGVRGQISFRERQPKNPQLEIHVLLGLIVIVLHQTGLGFKYIPYCGLLEIITVSMIFLSIIIQAYRVNYLTQRELLRE